MFLPSTFFFLYFLLVVLGPQSGGYGGPPWIFGDRGAGRVADVLIMSDSN